MKDRIPENKILLAFQSIQPRIRGEILWPCKQLSWDIVSNYVKIKSKYEGVYKSLLETKFKSVTDAAIISDPNDRKLIIVSIKVKIGCLC